MKTRNRSAADNLVIVFLRRTVAFGASRLLLPLLAAWGTAWTAPATFPDRSAETGIPFHRLYLPKDMKSSPINLAVVQDRRGMIYTATDRGVLEYDGVSWRQIGLKKSAAAISLAVDAQGTVYVGGVGEFGLLVPDSRGELRYVPLSEEVSATHPISWVQSVHVTTEGVYFRTHGYLFRWSRGRIRTWQTSPSSNLAFLVGGKLYVWDETDGLQAMEGNTLRQVPGAERLRREEVVFLLPGGRGPGQGILAGTHNGLYHLEWGKATPYVPEAAAFLAGKPLVNGFLLSDGNYAFHLRAKNLYGQVSREDVYRFRVLPPWYLTMWAYAGFALLGGLVVFSLVWVNTARLRKAKVRLERTVAERTADLQVRTEELKRALAEADQARQEADTANQAKSEFLSCMSHELRTPLNAIIGFSEVLLERHYGGLSDKQEEYVHEVLGGGRHLLSIINDILDMAKIEAGRMDLALSRFNLVRTVSGTMAMLREKCLNHGLEAVLDCPGELDGLEIQADQRKFKQILFNLISNALKFTERGSITLSVRQICHPDDGAAPWVEIAVADTGIGLRPEELTRVFETFYQARSSLSGKARGTGLGLPIVKKLVELHGGTIWAESAGEGRGSRFVFRLPLRHEPSLAP